MTWYYAEAGQQAGPVEETVLEEMFRAGKIQADTLVWREGMADWRPYSEAKPAPPPQPLLSPAPWPVGSGPKAEEVVCAECGQLFTKDNTVEIASIRVCAACKPRFVQKLREGAPLPGGGAAFDYAGFWVRFAAKFIDGLILGILVGLPVFLILMYFGAMGGLATRTGAGPRLAMGGLGLRLALILVEWAARLCYNSLFVGKFGATPGKMALGLKVIMADGSPVSYGRAFGRSFAEILSGMICYIGYIMAGFDSQKRALHDHICGTRVVRK